MTVEKLTSLKKSDIEKQTARTRNIAVINGNLPIPKAQSGMLWFVLLKRNPNRPRYKEGAIALLEVRVMKNRVGSSDHRRLRNYLSGNMNPFNSAQEVDFRRPSVNCSQPL